ncbi:Lipopolysaccharide heptosyltransferase 1 [Thiomonas sp. X19]|uniref:lipopolysaccharide heptosyltransferase I n=1 Tax=Thiomonas sp. X19 TaxID=1050370 RepID=UPI000B6CEAAC|nr:lipopolysaccharide heptosyltransferase I [Thiomonas sp. X19]SCC95276.1 Lipopolysaccharide heptosyltransferase 1 [Thiomonas sp. X19]
MRVLLVKTSSMGDIVHALPVVSDIKAAFPGAQVDWLVEEAYVPLVQAHPAVDRIIPLALRRWRKNLGSTETREEWRAMVRSLRNFRFDAVIDLQGLVKSALLARVARGPHIGLSWASSREPLAPLFYDRRMKTPLRRTEAAVPRYRQLAAWALGYAPSGPPRYGLQVQAERPAWLPGVRSFAVLLSATAKPRKLWAEDRWVALARWLHQHDIASVFAWGNAIERERAERLAAQVNATLTKPGAESGGPPQAIEDGAMAAPEAFGLDVWMQVLAASALVVGVDTGLLYLGAAVGTPAVAVYTGSSPRSVEFESAGPWRSLGDDDQPPLLNDVMQAVTSLLGLPLAAVLSAPDQPVAPAAWA